MSLVQKKAEFDRMIASGVSVNEAYSRAFPNGLTKEMIEKETASKQEKAALSALAGQVAGVTGAAYGVPWAAGKLGMGSAGAAGGATGAMAGTVPPITPVTGTAVPPVTPTMGTVGTQAGTQSVANNLPSTAQSSWLANNPAIAKGLGGLGAAAGAYGLYKTMEDPASRSRLQNAAMGGASGAALGAGGAALLGAAFGPVGLAVSLLGGAALGGFAKDLMGDKDRWKTEQDKVKALREKGIMVPHTDADDLRQGRSIGQLVQLSQDQINQGRYGNTIFARSRDVADLAPIDVQGSASMYERAGAGQENNARLRYELAKAALAANAIQEGYGSQTIDWSKVADADKIIQQYGNLGNKGQMTPEEWERKNYAWVQANRPQLMSIYNQMPGGAFKQAPSDSRRRNEKRK
jgi:hypothetical protein